MTIDNGQLPACVLAASDTLKHVCLHYSHLVCMLSQLCVWPVGPETHLKQV